MPADLTGIGVGEPDSVRGHDRDERDVGAGPDRLGDRLQNSCRRAGFDGSRGRWGIGQGRRDTDHLLPGRLLPVATGIEQGERGAGQHHHGDHQHLQRDGLSGERARPG